MPDQYMFNVFEKYKNESMKDVRDELMTLLATVSSVLFIGWLFKERPYRNILPLFFFRALILRQLQWDFF